MLCAVVVVSSKPDYTSNFDGFQLPEVIDNRVRSSGGYNYPKPIIPFDETTPINSFHPPQNNISIPPIQDELSPSYLPPFQDPAPPVYDPIQPPNTYLPQFSTKSTPDDRITILKMSCLDSKNIKFFRAQIRTNLNLPHFVEGVQSRGCFTQRGSNVYDLNLEQRDLVRCGVRRCGNGDFCVKLLIPAVRGLKLPEDAAVILQCKPQDHVATQVRSFKFNPRIL